jgi:hypothetical protein
MNYSKKPLLLLLGIALAFTSCKKDTTPNPDSPAPIPSGIDLKNFFKSNEASKVQTFTIDAANPISITGQNGTVITFSPYSFETPSGQNVTGNVTIQLIELFDKGEMILTNKPTMANFNGGLAPLVSGGEFKVTASQNGETLLLKNGASYYVEVDAPNGVDPNMELFYSENLGDTLTWNVADSSALWGQGNTYTGYFTNLNWINLDYFYNSPNPQTTVTLQAPAGYNNSNCMVFISFDGMQSVSSFYNFQSGLFTSAPAYTLPTGLPVHFIVVAMINNTPHVAIQSSTIVNNHLEVVSALTQTTAAQLTTDLSNLP